MKFFMKQYDVIMYLTIYLHLVNKLFFCYICFLKLLKKYLACRYANNDNEFKESALKLMVNLTNIKYVKINLSNMFLCNIELLIVIFLD